MILGACLFSYFIGSMINFSINNNSASKILQFKKITMEVFCDSSNISRPLKERIIQSLSYNSDKTFISLDDKNQLFHELPT